MRIVRAIPDILFAIAVAFAVATLIYWAVG